MEDSLSLLIPLVGVSIPLVIVAGRFIVQPIVDALSRVAVQQGAKDLGPLESRLAMTEERLGKVERMLDRIAEEQEFQRRLLTSRSGDRLESVRSEIPGS